MTTYKDIHGTKVEVRDDDPANPVNGQVWYNSGTLKGFKSNPVGSWATAANLNTTRYDGAVSMAGSKSSALFAGGYVSGIVANVETWNGTAWTEIADIPAATGYMGGTGASSTSALVFGGQNPGAGSSDKTYEWSGSSWAEGGDLNTDQRYRKGAGVQTAALAAGGNGGSPSPSAETEQYNGSAWTEVGDMNTARTNGTMGGGASPYTAALYFGGEAPPGRTGKTELWNGSGWTEVADMNTVRDGLGGAGTSTSGLAFGGQVPGRTVNTEVWNGSTWTEVNNLNQVRSGLSGAGASSASALAAGGTPTCAVEEWSQPVETTVSFTVS